MGGVIPEDSAHFALEIEGAKNVTAGGVVIEPGGSTPENFALQALLAAGGSAEEEDGFDAACGS